MFLKKINIKNFRGLKGTTLEFNDGLNILIGENNSGKTSILDALRICFSYGNQIRNIFVSKSDFYIDKKNPNNELEDIEFHLFFEIQNEEEAGIFIDLLSTDGDNQELQMHFLYYIYKKKGIEKVRYKVWGGDKEGQLITPELLDLIYFVYLGALRDAENSLKPVRGNRLGQLYNNIETDDEKKEFLTDKIRTVLGEDDDWSQLINSGEEKINEHLKETSISGKKQKVNVDFLPPEFRKTVDNLRIQIPLYDENVIQEAGKQKYFELYQNGLGYNNLIYTATVLGDLKRKKELENEMYIGLLIEEPEAHLHPQLQNIFFNYFSKLNQIGFQIFISSHSPTITAKAELDSLIILQNRNNEIKSLSVKNTNLSASNKQYLEKFLDVTKSQLLFSNGVILVEGISEALLIPILSIIMGEKYDISKKGIELVNINGVAFEHFGKLFNSDEENKRLNYPCVILTDDDRDDENIESPRAKKAKELESNFLKVVLAENTFEYELFMAGNNKNILLDIFSSIHPKASNNISEGDSVHEHAMNFVSKVADNKAKSELAHKLSIVLNEDFAKRGEFSVPDYISYAIKWVTNEED